MDREDFADAFYGLPEYVVTDIRTEELENGNTRVYHWVRRGRLLVPQFMALLSTSDLFSANGVVQTSLGIGQKLAS